MNRGAVLFALFGAATALFQQGKPTSNLTFVIAGNTLGYLQPCGCTDPMSGGISRLGTALKAINGPTELLYTGGMVSGDSRQDVLKAHALAESLGNWQVDACNLGASDAKLGMGELLTLNHLTKNRLMTRSLTPSPTNPIREGIILGSGYYVFGVSTHATIMARDLEEQAQPLEDSVEQGLQKAADIGFKPILLLDGDQETAVALAKAHAEFAIIAYNSAGNPPSEPEIIGHTYLVTPGEHGQYLVTLSPDSPQPYHAQPLTKTYQDDPETSRFYQGYLTAVTRENLWSKVPRISGPSFAGSQACASCHQESFQKWKHSGHAHALQTLNQKGHAWDPECLLCHVVGPHYRTGFQSLATTPSLAGVGCESCHGAGASHARRPLQFKLPKVSSGSCVSCHDTLNSPRFDYQTYWPRIQHNR